MYISSFRLTVTFAQARNFSINGLDLDDEIFVSFTELHSQMRQMDCGTFVMAVGCVVSESECEININ